MSTLEYVLLALTLLSLALHVIAPKTSNKYDDIVADVLDEVKAYLDGKDKPAAK